MTRPFGAALLLGGFLLVSCAAPKQTVQASSTLEEEVNAPAEAAPAAQADPAPAAEPTPQLSRIEVPEGFSVMMPKEPQIQRTSNQIKGGAVNSVLLLTNTGNAIFSVTRVEYPQAVARKAGPQKMLEETRTALAQQLKGEATVERAESLAGFPGEVFTVSGAENLLRARTAILDNHLYTLVVVYKGTLPAGSQEFLSSIQVASPPSQAPAPAPAPATPASAPAPAPAPAPARK